MAEEEAGRVRITHRVDPLEGYHGKPIISGGGSHDRYIGRVILELWERPRGADPGVNDVNYFSMTSDATDGDAAGLLRRLADALPVRVARDHPFEIER